LICGLKKRENKIQLQANKINGRHSYVIEYYNKARAGTEALKLASSDIKAQVAKGEIIVIGQELRQALENIIDDLENPEWYYDTADAELRQEFIETFCRHTKSPFYGQPFILELWEKAVIEAFYSFKSVATGQRRFKKCILLIARKNGKSTLCAALALTELMVNGGGIDIVCSSNDDAQADIIFQEIDNMRVQFDPRGRRTHKNLKGIFNLRNKSTVKKLSDRTRNKEGRNIDYAYIDEVHEMITNVIAKSIEQSQSTKDEPGLWEITTEGFENDGYLDHELVYARKVLNRKLEDPTLLVWLYTQDSEVEIWQDDNTHYKSNPSLGLVKKPSYLQEQIRKAKQTQADRVFTLAKDFNVKQNNAAAWLMEEDYINTATYDMEDFKGCIAVGGVDLAETTDLACAKVMIIKPGSSTKYVLTKYFIPEAKIEKGEEEDKKNYLQWAREGLIEVTPGNENDFSIITKWFVKLYKTWGIRFFKIGYDNALAKYWVTEMEDIGFDMEKVPQKPDALSEPMKLVEEDLKSKYVNYNNNPIDKWCLGNTAIKINNLGQIMPVKVEDRRTRRIDGAVALIIANAIYIRHRTDYLNLVR
jgi:phage terminase large subunit-like protein